ncbi:MAG: hypothetical protein ACLGSA_08705 [Acidobacteriota bacterium]
MKRIIATSVMGAFLFAAPAVFASDKAPLDVSAKGSVKTEGTPVAKKHEAADTAVPSAALKQDAAASAKADAVKSSDKAAVKTDAAKADDAKTADRNPPAKAAALEAKPAKPEAKPVTMKPAADVKHTAETAKKAEAAAVKSN